MISGIRGIRSDWKQGKMVVLIGFLTLCICSSVPQSTRGQIHINQVNAPTEAEEGSDGTPLSVQQGIFPDPSSLAREIWPAESEALFPDGLDGQARIFQTGSAHASHISQSGPGHSAVVVQRGSANRVDIEQTSTNQTAVVHQHTSRHTLHLDQNGGTNNSYVLDFRSPGAAGARIRHRIEQSGSYLRLYQVGNARIPFDVRQQGSHMTMMIRHER